MKRLLQSTALTFDCLSLEFKILDQRVLPQEERWLSIERPEEWIEIVQGLGIRGAPLIGVSAALCLAQWVCRQKPTSFAEIQKKAESLKQTRPTAVNLMRGIDFVMEAGMQGLSCETYLAAAVKFFEEDVASCEAMAVAGAKLVLSGDSVLTICNTGSLATVGVGTALGVIRHSYQTGHLKHVYALETRPLLQGARLTAWELGKYKIPFTLATDSMAATLMAQQKIQSVFVGADRIAANGDFANKIGTYSLAVLAKYHHIPFYVVAPRSTFDVTTRSGAEIVIEQRDPREVRGVLLASGYQSFAPPQCEVYNPSFDVTPRALVSGWVLDDQLLGENHFC